MPDHISLGDTVRVRAAPETEALGLAGKQGSVFGHTTPSVTGIEVVGEVRRDYAINVFFDEPKRSVWLAEELLTLVDHGAGTTISLDGVDKRWVRSADGSWIEHDLSPRPSRRPWWRFWR